LQLPTAAVTVAHLLAEIAFYYFPARKCRQQLLQLHVIPREQA